MYLLVYPTVITAIWIAPRAGTGTIEGGLPPCLDMVCTPLGRAVFETYSNSDANICCHRVLHCYIAARIAKQKTWGRWMPMHNVSTRWSWSEGLNIVCLDASPLPCQQWLAILVFDGVYPQQCKCMYHKCEQFVILILLRTHDIGIRLMIVIR